MNEVIGLAKEFDKRYRYTYVKCNGEWVRTTVMKEPKVYPVFEYLMAGAILLAGGIVSLHLLGVV